jgi:hypothetical protein
MQKPSSRRVCVVRVRRNCSHQLPVAHLLSSRLGGGVSWCAPPCVPLQVSGSPQFPASPKLWFNSFFSQFCGGEPLFLRATCWSIFLVELKWWVGWLEGSAMAVQSQQYPASVVENHGSRSGLGFHAISFGWGGGRSRCGLIDVQQVGWDGNFWGDLWS